MPGRLCAPITRTIAAKHDRDESNDDDDDDDDNNNNNNNTRDNVYGAQVISRVHPVHLTNVGQRQAAANHQPGLSNAKLLG